MSDEKIREEFEAWLSKNFGMFAGHFIHDGEEYTNFPTQCYWEVWKGSRAVIEIKLPDEQPGYQYYAPDVLEAIESAGLKVKP